MKKEGKTGQVLKKTAKGVRIAVSIAVTLFAVAVLAVWIFVGVRLWQWLAPLLANA